MVGERNIWQGKTAKIMTCRKSSAISAYLPLFSLLLLLLQLPTSSCVDLEDLHICPTSTTNLRKLAEQDPIWIRPYRNTTTLTLSTSVCDFNLTLSFRKEELITDHVEDVDGDLWGPLVYSLAPEYINITLIGTFIIHPIKSSSCITRNQVKVKFDSPSVVDVAFIKLSCVDDIRNPYRNLGGGSYNTRGSSSSTLRIPLKLIFIPFVILVACVGGCIRLFKRRKSSQSDSSAPTVAALNGVNATGGRVPYSNTTPVPPYSMSPVPNSSGPVPNSNAPVPPYPSGPVPNSSSPVPNSNAPVPNSNAPVPPYPSGPVPPYSMRPSNTSPSTDGSNPAYIHDNTKF